MPIALVVDTNILRQEGLASHNMKLLARVASSDELSLYLPEIVIREFLSQRELEVHEQVQKCAGAIVEISKQVGAKNPIQSELADINVSLSALEVRMKMEISNEINDWMASTKASQLMFEASDIKGVLDDYFAGTGAFRKTKHRDDFPDAIASASMRPLLIENEKVHVAVKDGAFRKHLQTEPKYIVIDSLNDFFGLDDVKQAIERLDAGERNVSAVKAFLAGALFQSRLTEYLRHAVELLENIYLEEGDIENSEEMAIDDAFGFSLNWAQAQSIADVQYAEVSYLAADQFSIGITIRTKAQIHFAANYMSIQDIPPTREIETTSMDGEGYCDLIEVRDVMLVGHIELRLDQNFGADVLEVHSQYLTTPETKIKIELEILKAAIL